MKYIMLAGMGIIAVFYSSLDASAAGKHKFVPAEEGTRAISSCILAGPTRQQILSNGDILCCYKDGGEENCTLCEADNDECLVVVETPRKDKKPSGSRILKDKFSPALKGSNRPVFIR